MSQQGLRIGFVSFRFAGTDGVSLETQKWARVLEEMGHRCYYFAGEADTPPDRTMIVPQAFIDHEIQEAVFGGKLAFAQISERISALQATLKEQLVRFVREFTLDGLIIQNALTIPFNIPLGLALTELIAETALPTLACHHTFFWEREQFLTGCGWDYLSAAFPPILPSLRHVTTNSQGAQQLSLRLGVSSIQIPNVMDFADAPAPPDGYSADLREQLGVAPDEKLVLLPTSISRRKGVEHAIELMRRLNTKASLVCSHDISDEYFDYIERVREFATIMGVHLVFAQDRFAQERGTGAKGEKIYSLKDAYQNADLIVFPTLKEGFGDVVLLSAYYQRPLVVQTYPVYAIDIKPKGFSFIEFSEFLTEKTVEEARMALQYPQSFISPLRENYRIAQHHYSLDVLRRRLGFLINDMFA